MKVLFALVMLAIATSAIAADQNLYGTTSDEMVASTDRYTHPRSVEEYRRIVPQKADIYGMCRSAGHVAQCVWALNGHQFPPPDAWVKALKGY